MSEIEETLPNGISVYNLQLTIAGGNIVLSFSTCQLSC